MEIDIRWHLILSMAGILVHGDEDAAWLASKALVASGNPNDDYFEIKRSGKKLVISVKGRAASLDKHICEPLIGLMLTGTLPKDQVLKVLPIHETREPEECLLEGIKESYCGLDTGYATIFASGSNLIGLRDPLGQRPLFYAMAQSHIVLSSCKKVIWALHDEPEPHPSGIISLFSNLSFRRVKVRTLEPNPHHSRDSLGEASDRLITLLNSSLENCTKKTNRVGVLFSGGLDSAVVACVAKMLGLKTRLYSAAFLDEKRLTHAVKVSEKLNLELHTRLVSEEDLDQAIRHTVWAAETADILQVSVALPLDVAIRAALEEGEQVLLTGSGADELFGGYARYLDVIRSLGPCGLSRAMSSDLKRLSERDALRDGALGESNRIQLYAPFLNLNVVEYALALPVGFKVKNPMDALRKHILREAAIKLNVPVEATYSPKKAAQFSSGSLKAVNKLAYSKGLQAQEYVSEVLTKVRKELVENARRVSRNVSDN
ncbi:MAG: asparagine synthase-related protein [Candidatus Bathyarchaeia archaeon]